MMIRSVIIFLLIFFLLSAQQPNVDTTQQPKIDSTEDTKNSLSVDPISIDPISVDPVKVSQDALPKQPEIQEVPSLNKQQQRDEKTDTKKQQLDSKDKNQGDINLSPDPRQKRQPNPNMDIELQKEKQQKIVEQAKMKQKNQEQAKVRAQRKRQQQIAREEAQKKNLQEIRRSAQYKAQQQRLNDLRMKRKKYEQQKKDEIDLGEKVEYNRDIEEDKLSDTENTRIEEKKKTRKIMSSLTSQTNIEVVLFEINTQIQQFLLRPSSSMQMHIHITVYVEKNNIYSFVSDVSETQPVRVYVYEDNNKIVGQIQSYFQGALKFTVKAGSVYAIRFYNSDGPKLINMNHPKFINSDLMNSFISADKGKKQFNTAKAIINGIKNSMNNMDQARLMDLNNAQILGKSMRKYFGYQIVEILVVGALCWIQIYFVKNMLKNPSIL